MTNAFHRPPSAHVSKGSTGGVLEARAGGGEDAGWDGEMNFVQANEPWLDAVPADWPSSRIRNVAQLSPSYSDGPPTPDELCTVVPMELVSESGAIDVTTV